MPAATRTRPAFVRVVGVTPHGGAAAGAPVLPERALNVCEPLAREWATVSGAYRPCLVHDDRAFRALGYAQTAVVASERIDGEQPEERVGLRERAGISRLERTKIPLDMLGIDIETIRNAGRAA